MQRRSIRFDGFDWDDGNRGKALRHGISDEEIEQVFFNEAVMDRQARNTPGEERRRALGETDAGRLLRVIFTVRARRGTRLIRPISVVLMSHAERRLHERRKRR